MTSLRGHVAPPLLYNDQRALIPSTPPSKFSSHTSLIPRRRHWLGRGSCSFSPSCCTMHTHASFGIANVWLIQANQPAHTYHAPILSDAWGRHSQKRNGSSSRLVFRQRHDAESRIDLDLAKGAFGVDDSSKHGLHRGYNGKGEQIPCSRFR